MLESIGVFFLAALSYWLRKLSLSGALCAILVGVSIAYGTGLPGLLLLAGFFISSVVWSMLLKSKKENDIDLKDGARDGSQVLANGGVAAILAVLSGVTGEKLFFLGFVVALAAATSDTWASELGRLSRGKPIDVIRFQRVKTGTSGAVSLLGTIAALMGSFFIVGLAYVIEGATYSLSLFLGMVLAGFIGNLVDTYVGATVQVKYRCQDCQTVTEKIEHCGNVTIKDRGYRIFNNESVNLLCTVVAPLFFFALYGIFR
ncbi:hypothetical protein AB990_12200 [Alkalihalobacillus pseudalcaliphilus]|nr:hypothetical protein AB990_12200 [Alkalihalobacillus pseudalcaliphilus]